MGGSQTALRRWIPLTLAQPTHARLHQPLWQLVEIQRMVPLANGGTQSGQLRGESTHNVLNVCISYLDGAALHVLDVAIRHDAAHEVDVVAVAVVCFQGAVLPGEKAAGVHELRIQRVLQVVLRREERPERRRLDVLGLFVKAHPHRDRAGTPCAIRELLWAEGAEQLEATPEARVSHVKSVNRFLPSRVYQLEMRD